MKKIIYSILFVSALFFTSCSDDDDNDSGNCFVCDDGTACDNGDGTFTDTYTEDGEEFTETYKYSEFGYENFAALKADGCDADDDDIIVDASECVTCAEYITQGVTVPAQEVCVLENGNAVVLDFDTGISYDLYITTLEISTTCE